MPIAITDSSPAHELVWPTELEFAQAVSRLLGPDAYQRLQSHYHASNFCTEIAQRLLTGRLKEYTEQAADLSLVSRIAHRLWHGDGTTGFVANASTPGAFKPRVTGV